MLVQTEMYNRWNHCPQSPYSQHLLSLLHKYCLHFCKYLEDALNKEAQKLITASQSEYKADILGLGESLKHNFTDMKGWRKFDWESQFPSAQIKVSFKVLYADFEEAN